MTLECFAFASTSRKCHNCSWHQTPDQDWLLQSFCFVCRNWVLLLQFVGPGRSFSLIKSWWMPCLLHEVLSPITEHQEIVRFAHRSIFGSCVGVEVLVHQQPHHADPGQDPNHKVHCFGEDFCIVFLSSLFWDVFPCRFLVWTSKWWLAWGICLLDNSRAHNIARELGILPCSNCAWRQVIQDIAKISGERILSFAILGLFFNLQHLCFQKDLISSCKACLFPPKSQSPPSGRPMQPLSQAIVLTKLAISTEVDEK